jgi:hypothetical protein
MSLNEGWDFERQQLTSGDDDDRCYLIMHRTFAFIAEDDDGASSAQLIHLVADYYQWGANDMDNETIAILGLSSDDVDWVTGVSSDCPEPEDGDGGYDMNECVDGEQGQLRGMIRTCVEGLWGAGQPIFCGWNYNVTNNVCVPCPEGSVNEAGDDASSVDTTCDTNHPPVIDHLSFAGEFVTNETDYVCLDFTIHDEDGDEIDGTATWLINGVSADSLPIDECFYFAEYDEGTDYEIGDELSVTIIVWDGEYEATATITTIIEEEPE